MYTPVQLPPPTKYLIICYLILYTFVHCFPLSFLALILILQRKSLRTNKKFLFYAKQCYSDINAKALSQTLGVLYGSLEYWTNSNNVEYWSKIYLEEEEKTESCVTFSATKATENEDTDDRTLSKSEWLQTVAAADAIGAATSGGALAAACSAAAALYFDVE